MARTILKAVWNAPWPLAALIVVLFCAWAMGAPATQPTTRPSIGVVAPDLATILSAAPANTDVQLSDGLFELPRTVTIRNPGVRVFCSPKTRILRPPGGGGSSMIRVEAEEFEWHGGSIDSGVKLGSPSVPGFDAKVGVNAFFIVARNAMIDGIAADNIDDLVQTDAGGVNVTVQNCTGGLGMRSDFCYLTADGATVKNCVMRDSRNEHGIRIDCDANGHKPAHISIENCEIWNSDGKEAFTVRQGGGDISAKNCTFHAWCNVGQGGAPDGKVYAPTVTFDACTWPDLRPGGAELQIGYGVRDLAVKNCRFAVDAAQRAITIQPDTTASFLANVLVAPAGIAPKPLTNYQPPPPTTQPVLESGTRVEVQPSTQPAAK